MIFSNMKLLVLCNLIDSILIWIYLSSFHEQKHDENHFLNVNDFYFIYFWVRLDGHVQYVHYKLDYEDV